MSDIIPPIEISIDTYDPHPSGIRVGTPHGIKITHLPTGTVVSVITTRSQHKNRALAMEGLEAILTSPLLK